MVRPYNRKGGSLHYCKYTETALENAVKDVVQGMSFLKASQVYGVPRATINDRIRKVYPLGLERVRAAREAVARRRQTERESRRENDRPKRNCVPLPCISEPITSTMNLRRVVRILDAFAPAALAEKWDNVGLLIEPSAGPDHSVDRLMLTNDLTEAVLDEGIKKKVNMIISYHPPIFTAFKRLCGGGQDASDWKQRLIVRCVENRIAVYSPHTAWDAAPAGVNNWLAKALDCSDGHCITKCEWNDYPLATTYSTLCIDPFDDGRDIRKDEYDEMIKFITSSEELKPYLVMQDLPRDASSDELEKGFSVTCPTQDVTYIQDKLTTHNPAYDSHISWSLSGCNEHFECGMGRICNLKNPLSLKELVDIIKRHLNVSHVQLAVGRGVNDTKERSINRVALCAGSGASVLREAEKSKCDVYWTGEMSHHEVLDTVAKGISVILCGHSNTERGFLTFFAPKLREMLLDKVDVLVSAKDADPLVVI